MLINFLISLFAILFESNYLLLLKKEIFSHHLIILEEEEAIKE